jgi:hypothetical protein
MLLAADAFLNEETCVKRLPHRLMKYRDQVVRIEFACRLL